MQLAGWWGKSMYGGYYADVYNKDDTSERKSFHAETLKQLRAELAEYGIPKLSVLCRYDN